MELADETFYDRRESSLDIKIENQQVRPTPDGYHRRNGGNIDAGPRNAKSRPGTGGFRWKSGSFGKDGCGDSNQPRVDVPGLGSIRHLSSSDKVTACQRARVDELDDGIVRGLESCGSIIEDEECACAGSGYGDDGCCAGDEVGGQRFGEISRYIAAAGDARGRERRC